MTRIDIIDRAIEAGLVALAVLIAAVAIHTNALSGFTAAFSQWYANLVDSFLVVEDLVVDAPTQDGYHRLTASDTDQPVVTG